MNDPYTIEKPGFAAADDRPDATDPTTSRRGSSIRRTDQSVTADRLRPAPIQPREARIGASDAGSDDPWVEDRCVGDQDDVLVTSRQVRARIGGVTAMCVWRWTRDGKFPAPMRINGRNYWRASVVRAWIMAQGGEARPRGDDVDCGRPAAVRTGPRRIREVSK